MFTHTHKVNLSTATEEYKEGKEKEETEWKMYTQHTVYMAWIFKGKTLKLCVKVCMLVCANECRYMQQAEASDAPLAGVIDDSEPPNLGDGNRTYILFKSSLCFSQSPLSSTKIKRNIFIYMLF